MSAGWNWISVNAIQDNMDINSAFSTLPAQANDYIKSQLKNKGIQNIEIIKKDTYLNKNNFFSSRRSLKKKLNDYGRNISIIMIK